MNLCSHSSLLRSVAAVAVGVFVTSLSSTAGYQFTDLGDPGLVDYVYPYAPKINNHGEVAYTLISTFPDYSGYFASGGTLTRVPPLDAGTDLPGHDNFAFDLNDHGIVVGESRINASSATSHAYYSTSATASFDITPLPATEDSSASRVTNSGLVLVSGGNVYSVIDHTFTPEASFIPAGATLIGVSDEGTFLSSVGGDLYTSQAGVHTPLAGSFTGSFRAINDESQILSLSGNTVYLLTGGVSTSLGSIADLTELNGFNDDGVAVGTYNLGLPVDPANHTQSETRAYGTFGGGLIDLNTLINPSLGYTLLNATDINDHGQITGVAFTPDGVYHPYILSPDFTPVPEPATYGIMATGLLGMIVVIRRRQMRTRRDAVP